MRSEPPTGDELTRLLVSAKRNVLEQVAQEPAPKKRSTVADRVIGLVLGVALLLGVGAGAAFALGVIPPLGSAPLATTPSPTAASAPTSSPTPPPTPPTPPTEYSVIPGQPASRYGLTCEMLIDASVVSDFFITDVAPADPIVSASGVGIAIPRRTSVLSEGGTVCEWSNGLPYNDQYGHDLDYVGVTVTVVPQPTAGWSERAVAFGMPSDFSSCHDFGCTANAALGDAWVAVEAVGDPSEVDASGWQQLVDAVVASVAAAGPAAPAVAPQHVSMPRREDCEGVIPLDAVRSITASPDAQAYRGIAGGWSEWAEARLHADNIGCKWSIDGEESSVAKVDWVRDGRWAFERMLLAGTAESLELDGLSPNDAAALRCDVDFGATCAVDLRLGQDWFNVVANDRATAIALAEAAVVQLAAR